MIVQEEDIGMKLNIHDIEEQQKHLDFEEPAAAVNALLQHGGPCDFQLPHPVRVALAYHRMGHELFFSGQLDGRATGTCARCLEEYPLTFHTDFHLTLVPQSSDTPESEALDDDEVGIGYYNGEEIDLSALLHEHVLLALPTLPLCQDACKGLCAQCGQNQNQGACQCDDDQGDPRLAILRTLKVSRQS